MINRNLFQMGLVCEFPLKCPLLIIALSYPSDYSTLKSDELLWQMTNI